MHPAEATRALAQASAALVDDHDVPGFLATLLASAQHVLGAAASGILVADGPGLEVLAASSHDASDLELHQSQFCEGPCVEAFRGATALSATTATELVRRWPRIGLIMVESGYECVHASPLRWHGKALGAMGVFRSSDTPFTAEEAVVAQAFADIATLLIVQTERVDITESTQRIQDALATRVVIEQAKGALAELKDVPMNRAYVMLLERAAAAGETLTATARAVVADAQRS